MIIITLVAAGMMVEFKHQKSEDKGLEDIRSTPTSNSNVDQQMLCDIQRAISILIGKAPQLIGMANKFIYSCLTM